jgi:hypothetical protein
METTNLQTVIGTDGKLRIEIPSRLPPGPAEVVVTVRTVGSARPLTWRDFYGLGRQLWAGEDAQEFVNRLRDEWHHEPAG